MKKIILLLGMFAICFSCNSQEQKTERQPAPEPQAEVKTKPPIRVNCNDPDAPGICMFMYMPQPKNHIMDIKVPEEEQNLTITGKVLNAKTNEPYAGILLYAYHTDEKGIYSKSGRESGVRKIHGLHHGWCKTDAEGNYEICTRKPGTYPSRDTPAHIHLWVKLNEDNIFYTNDFVFDGDPLIDDNYLKNLDNKNNPKKKDDGIVELKKEDGKYIGERDILIVE